MMLLLCNNYTLSINIVCNLTAYSLLLIDVTFRLIPSCILHLITSLSTKSHVLFNSCSWYYPCIPCKLIGCVCSDLSRLLCGGLQSPYGGGVFRPYVYQLPPYFPKFMLFYVTWPSIQQGLQIDNILVNCLCAHTPTVSPLYMALNIFYWL